MLDPNDKPLPVQSGDGGMTAPRVFDTIEEAVLAGTAEDRYLESLDEHQETEQ